MSPTILVVDDAPPIRKRLRTGLATQGYALLEAPNAATPLVAVLAGLRAALRHQRVAGDGDEPLTPCSTLRRQTT